MSAWTKIRNTVAVGVATYYGGAAGGAAVAKYQAARSAAHAMEDQSQPLEPAVNTFTPVASPASKAGYVLPAVGRLAGPLGAALTGRGVMASAMTYCRRHPAWCATIGLTGVAELVRGGSLPPVKRRRRKGISASDLSKFRRVAGFLYKWGPMCSTGAKPRARATRR